MPQTENEKIKVVISGIGKMGIQTAQAIQKENDMEIIGAINHRIGLSKPFQQIFDIPVDVNISKLREWNPDVIIDFSNTRWTNKIADFAISNRINLLIGTSGFELTQKMIDNFQRIQANEKIPEKEKPGIAIIPNFSLGIMFLEQYIRIMSGSYDNVEIIEYHSEEKIDSPSQTAIQIAKNIQENNQDKFQFKDSKQHNAKDQNARGANTHNIPIHSIRIPDIIARHDIIFSKQGERIAIQHETTSRESFTEIVVHATRRMPKTTRIAIGLEDLLLR